MRNGVRMPALPSSWAGGLLCGMCPLQTPDGTVVWQKGPHWFEAQRLNSLLLIYGRFLMGKASTGVWQADSNNGTKGTPYRVDTLGLPTSTATSDDADASSSQTSTCVVRSLSNSDVRSGLDPPTKWLVGQFNLAERVERHHRRRQPDSGYFPTPSPSPSPPSSRSASASPLPRPRSTRQVAVMLQNQDENNNVWTTVEWLPSVNGTTVLELGPVDGKLKPVLDDSPWLPGLQLALDAGGARLLVVEFDVERFNQRI